MALSLLCDASGTPLMTTDGQYLYVDTPTVPGTRMARVPREGRMVKVGKS